MVQTYPTTGNWQGMPTARKPVTTHSLEGPVKCPVANPTERAVRHYPDRWDGRIWWAAATAQERRRLLLAKLDATQPLPATHFFNR